MKYSFIAKNTTRDIIYQIRLRLIRNNNINVKSSPEMYAYYRNADLGIILM